MSLTNLSPPSCWQLVGLRLGDGKAVRLRRIEHRGSRYDTAQHANLYEIDEGGGVESVAIGLPHEYLGARQDTFLKARLQLN